jgi:hypothetical protein
MIGMLFLHFKRASVAKFLSIYPARIVRMPWDDIKEIVQELDTIGKFNQDTLSLWNDWMSEHNRIVERGERMMLLQCRARCMSWLKYRSLDLFMLQMQCRHLAKLLTDFSSFGERVLRLIQESPGSLFWVVGGPIVVEHTRWAQLCEHMMTLLHVLGVAKPSPTRRRRRLWPDRELLEAAAARVRGVFGRFARGDSAMPTIRARPSPKRHGAPSASARDGPVATKAEPQRRAVKHLGDDSDQLHRQSCTSLVASATS